jgi:N-acetyl-gamma-glutamyl-phosphate reductase
MKHRVGITGVSGYGGGEALRLLASHPSFEVVYVSGESSAGTKLGARYPGLPERLAPLVVEKFDPTSLPELDVLFASLPTGLSREPLAAVRKDTKIVDIGGDHRYADGWVYGLADIWPEKLADATRVANPGCYPAATLTALAPLLSAGLIEPNHIIVDAKSGVSGAGRGGGDNRFGYSETNEDLAAYGLLKHTHMPEIAETIRTLAGTQVGLVFTPHLVPMTRGILATIYARGDATAEQCVAAAREFYRDRPFVRVVDTPPHTKWATGSNLAFVYYAADPTRRLVMAIAAIDNLGKGAAGQAIQNANLISGFDATAGLGGLALWP